MISTAFILAATVLTNIADVTSAVFSNRSGERFSTVGTVMAIGSPKNALFILSSPDGNQVFRDGTQGIRSQTLHPGNVIRASGVISGNEYGYTSANCQSIDFLADGTPPVAEDVPATELNSARLDGRLIRVRGTVQEVFRDEIDPKYIYLALNSGGRTFYVSCCDDMAHEKRLMALTDAEVAVSGIYTTRKSGLRKLFGWMIITYDPDSIEILRPAPADPFDIPSLERENPASQSDVLKMGRRRTTGLVIAVRQDKDALIRDASGAVRTIRFRNNQFPTYGTMIEVAGCPETDLYRINLRDAVWRESDLPLLPDEVPSDIPVADILADDKGHFKINPTFHGRTIRIRGTVIDRPESDRGPGLFTLKCDGYSVPVDISANRGVLDGLSVGCTAEVSGTCVVETDNSYSTFPHATGITVVVRTPDDVRILSRPPWWTPRKFLVVVSSLLLALIVFVVWNRILNRLVARRSRALLKEQLALAEAELKIGERTRLAIELHDSLSQNLAAVACQIAATESAVDVGRDETVANLRSAERMLLSCRTELRRCLWDLRNDTLDEKNMTEVVRRVLKPVVGDAELRIRFNVPRQKLDDSTAHAIIRIIRELASNAVRHGRAAHIAVAGDLTDGTLAFSVTDDGCGFDPATCDGPGEGHFGLEGIRERVERLRGTFELRSSPGNGTYAKIAFTL